MVGRRSPASVCSAQAETSLPQREKASGDIGFELREGIKLFTKQALDFVGRAVAEANPDNFRRRAPHHGESVEIGIARDQNEAADRGRFPDVEVMSAPKVESDYGR